MDANGRRRVGVGDCVEMDVRCWMECGMVLVDQQPGMLHDDGQAVAASRMFDEMLI